MTSTSSLKVPLRSPDRVLLLIGILTLGVSAVFWAAPPVEEQVITQTRTMTSLSTETRVWTTQVTTRSLTTQTITTVILIPIIIPGQLGVRSFSQRVTTSISVGEVTGVRTETIYSAATLMQSSQILETSIRRIVQSSSVQTLLCIAISVLMLGLTYYRVHEYRTRLHIYYEILKYVSTPKIATHIMRRCNLETGKFNKYVNELQTKGFVNVVQRDDTKEYVVTDKSLEYLRDEKLARFIAELS